MTAQHLPEHKRYDPLQASSEQASAFNRAWFKHGESLTPVQRVGFAICSLMFILIGFFLGLGCWEDFQSKDVTAVLWAVGTLFFLGIGFRGLRNTFARRGKN